MKDVELLDKNLCNFFSKYKVGKRGIGLKDTDDKKVKGKRPKTSSAANFLSFLKNYILKNSKVDITNSNQFPKFGQFWKGYTKKLKELGLGDTEHNDEIERQTLEAINNLLVVLFQLMTKPATDDDYKELLEEVPKSYKDQKTGKGKVYMLYFRDLQFRH